MSASGGAHQTAHQITLPSGVTLNFAGQTNEGGDAAGLTFDPVLKQLYLSNANEDGVNPDIGTIDVLQWDDANKTVSKVTSFDTATLVGTTPGSVDPFDAPSTTTFDNLPTLVTGGTGTHAGEQGTAVTLLTSTPTITDVDGDHLASATVQITGGTFTVAGNDSSANDDHLTINGTASGTVGGTSITYSYNSATETLTLSGYDTLADYQTALSEVKYSTTGDNPTDYGLNASRTITWQVNDGAIGNPSGTNTTTTTLNIDAVDDAPVASAPASYTAAERVALNLHNASLNVSDVDGGIAGQNETATLSVTEGILTAAAGTGASNGVGISGSGTGTLTITGTVAEINGLLNGDATSTLTFTGDRDADDTPSGTTLSLSISDGGFTGSGGPQVSNTAQSTISAPDDTAVTFHGLSGNTSGSPVEGQQITATITDGGLTVSGATYTWRVGGTIVQQGSANTYTPIDQDEGKALTLDLSFNDPGNGAITESDNGIAVGSPDTVQENPAENATISISGLTGGNAVEGTQLTATVTDPDAPAGGITYTWIVNGSTVHTGVDALGKTYTPGEGDENLPISVSVSFTDTNGNPGETGSASAGIVQEKPAENATISLSGLTGGNAVEGTQLTATVTDLDAPASGITYTWTVNGSTVHTGVDGAGNTYTPNENDEGLPVSVSVSFTDTHGDVGETGTVSAGTVQENPTENASFSVSGLVSGHVVEGNQLTATVTEPDAPASGIPYTWKVNGSTVHTGVDAAGSSYTPTDTDEGKPISLAVSFTDTHGFAENGSSTIDTVRENAAENATISLSGLTSGNAIEGTQLTATVTDVDAPASGITYTWTVNGSPVHTGVDAAGSTYTPTENDEGRAISVAVSFTDTNGNAGETGLASAGTVQENPAENATISLSGLTGGNAVGGTQIVATVTDADAPASGITFTWKVNGSTVHTGVDGAGSTYMPTDTDEGAPISVAIAFTDTHGNAETGSKSAGTVQENPAENATIALSGLTGGNAIAGKTVAATVTDLDAPASNITYTWTVNGATVHAGVDAAGSSYTPTTADKNLPLSVAVAFTDTHGNAETGSQSAGVVHLGNTVPGDFGGNGMSGVLWRQSSTETFVQWSMNGPNVTSSQSNTYRGTSILPDASWNVVATGDFNGDGDADILWRNTNGTLQEWQMNGSTIVSSDLRRSGKCDFSGFILERRGDGRLQRRRQIGHAVAPGRHRCAGRMADERIANHLCGRGDIPGLTADARRKLASPKQADRLRLAHNGADRLIGTRQAAGLERPRVAGLRP